MIARVWRGVVARDRQAAYVTYVDTTGVAEYRRADGCRLSMILTRDLANDPDTSENDTRAPHHTSRAEVIAFSIWDSEAAIQAFAGEDINAMVLYPEDKDFLLETPSLTHHQVDSFSIPAPTGPDDGRADPGPERHDRS